MNILGNFLDNSNGFFQMDLWILNMRPVDIEILKEMLWKLFKYSRDLNFVFYVSFKFTQTILFPH